MAHVRQQVSDIIFGPYHYENHLNLFDIQRANLEDAASPLLGSPSQIQSKGNVKAPSDVRLCIDRQDATSSLVHNLKGIFDNASASLRSSPRAK
jgi:hypothetical protein